MHPHCVDPACACDAQVGFVDAFVLRNVMARQTAALLARCDALDAQDAKLSTVLRKPHIAPPAPDLGISGPFYRVSFFFSRLAGHTAVTLAAVGVVVLLLAAATAMGWSETAQLLCNSPTMIIEGGMLLVLMMAHMASHRFMRGRLQALLQRRLAFQAALDGLAAQLGTDKLLDAERIKELP
jgi:low-affinity ferrous iron transport protein